MFIYSPEALPNPKFMGHPMYNPEYIQVYAGINFTIGEGEWIEIPDSFRIRNHRDWVDRSGRIDQVHLRDRVDRLRRQYGPRGVSFFESKPKMDEKQAAEEEGKRLNLEYRRRAIEEYESQVREKEVTGFGRTQPTPYEEECYAILGETRPYSVDALRAQRRPGEESAERIAKAIEGALKRDLPKSQKEFPASPGGA